MATPSPAFHFLGVRFWNAPTDQLLAEIDQKGGMLAVPSAPSLAQMSEDPLLKTAYQQSHWSVMDGGYVALVLRAMGRNCRRISGLQLVQKITANAGEGPLPMQERKILWVVPTPEEEQRIDVYLKTKGFSPERQTYYRAPFYQKDEDFNDSALTALCGEVQPDWIVLCLGGGRQEKVAYFLTQNLSSFQADAPVGSRRPAILCTGAAIAFLTGGQANIPTWADRLYLGWFLRIAKDPGAFIPRYFKAAWHFPLALWKLRGTWFTAVS
ncbi:MAG: glycosyltransferase [Akkermansiaceae bacterium]|nr:glycosyltransferase [Akkermansiaceae bacterium]